MEFKIKSFDKLTASEIYEILKSRQQIFMLEQKILCLDADGVDYKSVHFFIEDNNEVIAYLRAFYDSENKDILHIGRVLTLKHGNGYGRELMEKSLSEIKKSFNCKKICMHSQKHAAGFYEKFGFKITSDEFLEEGIVHVMMEMDV